MQTSDLFDFPIIRGKKFCHSEVDPLFEEAAQLIIKNQNASASFIQRALSLGYARAARILDELEQHGIVGPVDGANPRQVFFSKYSDFLSSQDNAEASRIPKEEDYSWYKTPSVDFSGLGFVPKLWQVPFGTDGNGDAVEFGLEQLGHLLIIGNPLSRKMEFVDAVICSQLLCANPDQVRFVFIDHSSNLRIYDGIPHLLSPTVHAYDRGYSALKWLLSEMDRRQDKFIHCGVRSYESYIQLKDAAKLPRIIVVLRWLEEADTTAESELTRITSLAHNTGIHLFLVSDYGRSKFLTAQIKANFPYFSVFKTTSASDSRSAGVSGAEELGLDEALLKSLESYEPVKLRAAGIPEAKVKQILNAIPRA